MAEIEPIKKKNKIATDSPREDNPWDVNSQKPIHRAKKLPPAQGKTMPVSESPKLGLFDAKNRKKKKVSMEKTMVIPELSQEAIIDDVSDASADINPENPKFITTAITASALSEKTLFMMRLKRWWFAIVAMLITLGLVLWQFIF